MTLLTVIVPMYNVAEYLPVCLDSLVAQTLRNGMKVILVDDGCTDETPMIAQRYVAEYPDLFSLLHKENGGLSDARNVAMPLVKSDYIAFLDSDDWVEETTYEKMVRALQETEGDVVVSDIDFAYKDKRRCYTMKGLSDWPADTVQKKALLSPLFAWNKVYRSSFFTGENGYRYPKGLWYEDLPVTTRIFAKATAIAYVNEPLFHYRQREGSIMANTSSQKLSDIFMILQQVREGFENDQQETAYHVELEYLHIEHLCLYGMFRFIRSNQTKELRNHAWALMNTLYPDWHKNRYIKNLNKKNRVFLATYNSLTAFLYDAKIRSSSS